MIRLSMGNPMNRLKEKREREAEQLAERAARRRVILAGIRDPYVTKRDLQLLRELTA